MLTLKYACRLQKSVAFDMFVRKQLFFGNKRTKAYICNTLKSSVSKY